jgi:hypothetical protein
MIAARSAGVHGRTQPACTPEKNGRKPFDPMAHLVEKLTAPDIRPKVVQSCVDLVESEVAAKRGLSGAAIKAGYKVVKALKPGMVPSVIDTLLPEFAAAMQPLFDKSTDGGAGSDAFTQYITAHPDETADALLTVTDTRAERAQNRTVKKTYERLRGTAKDNVRTAVPGLAATLGPYLE